MLLAALNLPFSENLYDTERFIACVESEIVSTEFDVLVLPAQPYLKASDLYLSQAQQEQHTHVLVKWMCAISRQKRALIVCGTSEWTKEQALYRTALASYDGQLVARHVMWPASASPSRMCSISNLFTPIHMPMFTAAIMLDEDIGRPISLTALCTSDTSMCLVPSLKSHKRLAEMARAVAARFGVYVVLADYTRKQSDESSSSGSAIVSPMGNAIAARIGDRGLQLAEVPDVPSWINTGERDSHKLAVIAVTHARDGHLARPNNLRESDGFYSE